MEHILTTKDTNKDGVLTKQEYLIGEADAEAAGKNFDKYNKNRDLKLSEEEIYTSLGFRD